MKIHSKSLKRQIGYSIVETNETTSGTYSSYLAEGNSGILYLQYNGCMLLTKSPYANREESRLWIKPK